MHSRIPFWTALALVALLDCRSGLQGCTPPPPLVTDPPVRAEVGREPPAAAPSQAVVASPVVSPAAPVAPAPTVAPVPASPDASQPRDPTGTSALASLRDEVQNLKTRSAQLEQQLTRLDQENRERAQAVEELHALRTQVSDDAAERRTTETRAAQHAQNVDQAITGLFGVARQLETGDTDVEGALGRAEQLLGPHARLHLGAIRTALDNHDLAAARALLEQSIIDAQISR